MLTGAQRNEIAYYERRVAEALVPILPDERGVLLASPRRPLAPTFLGVRGVVDLYA
jgi:hypothetical protein